MSLLTVFGGTGFLGRRVGRHLREAGETVRIASRHPGPVEDDGFERIVADVHDARSVETAVAGADGVVNTVSLYVEHGRETFWSVHVEGAAQVAGRHHSLGSVRISGARNVAAFARRGASGYAQAKCLSAEFCNR